MHKLQSAQKFLNDHLNVPIVINIVKMLELHTFALNDYFYSKHHSHFAIILNTLKNTHTG